jgi:hypothetical protein
MWNRFDIAAAYYHFAHCNRWGWFNALDEQEHERLNQYCWRKAHQLARLRYKPGLSNRQLATISPNAKAIYMGLVRRYLGVHSTAPLPTCRLCGAEQQEHNAARCHRCNARLIPFT